MYAAANDLFLNLFSELTRKMKGIVTTKKTATCSDDVAMNERTIEVDSFLMPDDDERRTFIRNSAHVVGRR